jgi:hypothetical protein
VRVLLAAIALTMAAAPDPARAQYDPYRWCAEYGDRGGGGTNCYFRTLQQCQWAISGRGGFCRPNLFYTGPERRGPRKGKKWHR